MFILLVKWRDRYLTFVGMEKDSYWWVGLMLSWLGKSVHACLLIAKNGFCYRRKYETLSKYVFFLKCAKNIYQVWWQNILEIISLIVYHIWLRFTQPIPINAHWLKIWGTGGRWGSRWSPLYLNFRHSRSAFDIWRRGRARSGLASDHGLFGWLWWQGEDDGVGGEHVKR